MRRITKAARIEKANELRRRCFANLTARGIQKRRSCDGPDKPCDVRFERRDAREAWLWIAGEILSIQSPSKPVKRKKGTQGK